ncbi:MAG: RNA methyltransferase [Planctomycetota bacterium]
MRIQSRADPRLRTYLDLKDRDLRRETGLFLAEGEHVVRRAFAAGLRVRSVLVVESKVPRVEAMIADAGRRTDEVEVLACSKSVIEDTVGFQMHQGIIAAVEPPPSPEWSVALRQESDHAAAVILVCPETTNVDNLGLLVRVAAGLGVRAMVLGPRCADPWYRRAVRVSMGAVFTLPILRSGDLDADLGRLRDDFGYELIATVTDPDAPPLHRLKRSEIFRGRGRAVLLGSEGYGLPAELVARCDRRVRVPMHHDVDSLNVAVAAGIVIHHLVTLGPGGE